MPLYEYKCEKCGLTHDRYCKIKESENQFICSFCGDFMRKVISPMNVRSFKPQFVGATLTDKDGGDVNQYVRNKQELTDAINRYNDTERASKTGRVAILE